MATVCEDKEKKLEKTDKESNFEVFIMNACSREFKIEGGGAGYIETMSQFINICTGGQVRLCVPLSGAGQDLQ